MRYSIGMVVATGIFRVVLVAVSCVLAAYEEKLSAADRYGDDLTRFVWNYLGQLLALGERNLRMRQPESR